MKSSTKNIIKQLDYQNFTNKFSNAIEILEILEKNGFKAFFVGGCVRDFLMDKGFNDIDITTSAKPEEIKSIFQKTFDTGIKHGTVTVVYNNMSYEITTFRSESDYINYRHPNQVEFQTSIDKDLERRDFTINAMAMNAKGELTDYHYGLEDIEHKLIKTVNQPDERFNEDALRMLRAFRFAAKLGFDIDKCTFEAIVKNASLIQYISIERIVAEFKKLFEGEHNIAAYHFILKSGLNQHIPFFVKVNLYDRDLSHFSFEQALYYLVYLNHIPYEELLHLKLSNQLLKKIKQYHYINEMFLSKYAIEEILYRYAIEDIIFINNLFHYQSEDYIKTIKLPIYSVKDLAVSPKEIIALFPDRKSGSWIKEIINKIERLILLGKLKNTKEDIIKHIIVYENNR